MHQDGSGVPGVEWTCETVRGPLAAGGDTSHQRSPSHSAGSIPSGQEVTDSKEERAEGRNDEDSQRSAEEFAMDLDANDSGLDDSILKQASAAGSADEAMAHSKAQAEQKPVASPRLHSPRLQSGQSIAKNREKEKSILPKSRISPLHLPKSKDSTEHRDKLNSPRLPSPKLRPSDALHSKEHNAEKGSEKENGGTDREASCEPTSTERGQVKRSSVPQIGQSKCPSPLIVKSSGSSAVDNLRRVHPVGKEKEKLHLEKDSSIIPAKSRSSSMKPMKSDSSSLSAIRPNVGARMPICDRPALHPYDQPLKESPASHEKRRSTIDCPPFLANSVVDGPGSEDDHCKVKDFFHRRKSMENRKFGESASVASSEHLSVMTRENKDLGPFLLKLAKQAVISGDNPQKALDYATRAAKSYEATADGKPCRELLMSLHFLAAIHCSVGQFEEAISVLQHSIDVADIQEGGQEYALVAFASNMQLGDIFMLLGRGEDALLAYHTGFELQKQTLGDMDPRVGETCRHLAEAHAQAMQFDKAETLCQHALEIHKEHSPPASVEEAIDRRLMGLICNAKGQFETGLEHLVLASMSLIANGKDTDVATVDTSIGDSYVCLGRFDEAIFAYQKALTVLKASKGESDNSVALIYVSLADLYVKTGKLRESRTYCEIAQRIFNKYGEGVHLDEIANGLTQIAAVYEALNEKEQALSLLEKALALLEFVPGQQCVVAGVEAQIGVLNYLRGNYAKARSSFTSAVSKMRVSAEKSSPLFGIVLNQMGLCCLHLSEVQTAAELLEESRVVLQAALGPHHPDTLAVYSNLAGAYDAMGRLDEAIGLLQHVVVVWEEELGTANPEVDDEKERLAELLKEAGRFRTKRVNNTLGLLMNSKAKQSLTERSGISSIPVNG